MTWDEERHPRDARGQFTHSSVGAWASKVAEEMRAFLDQRHGRGYYTFDASDLREAHDEGDRPPGYAVAVAEHRRLWNIPSRPEHGGLGRERTDAEHDEAVALDDAFGEYRDRLGLVEHPDISGHYTDSDRNIYDEYGEMVADAEAAAKVRVSTAAPRSLAAGYRRVGDHPERHGAVGGPLPRLYGWSSHPAAGGVWVDPQHPGTNYQPRLLNDLGVLTNVDRRPTQRSEARRRDRESQRSGWMRGTPSGSEYSGTQVHRDAGGQLVLWRKRKGRGYGAVEDNAGDIAMKSQFINYMHRAQPRARQETARQPVRRTPRGTQVDSWMQHVNDRIEQTRGRETR